VRHSWVVTVGVPEDWGIETHRCERCGMRRYRDQGPRRGRLWVYWWQGAEVSRRKVPGCSGGE